MSSPRSGSEQTWITRSVVGIVLATFFSDVGHEMVTAVLPLYLASVGMGPAILGVMEGLADLLFSVSKLAGGLVGHRTDKKRGWATLGYLTTTIGTGAIALVQTVAGLISLRAVAWFGRGFRSPLRDFMLSDEVGPTHFGRAYGVERAADMVGAVVGPLVAAGLVWLGIEYRSVILISIGPSILSVLAIYFMTRDRTHAVGEAPQVEPEKLQARGKLPRRFWWFLGGVTIFGLGDFSRTFLIFLAAAALGESGHQAGALSIAVLLYTAHNAVSAVAAIPSGRLGDRVPKLRVLVGGYAIGVVTNSLLAVGAGSLALLIPAIALSGIYIAVEETIEKATAAEMLPREQRSLGFGILACANAIGDMGASLFVGIMLASGHTTLAFAVPAAMGAIGTVWMAIMARGE